MQIVYLLNFLRREVFWVVLFVSLASIVYELVFAQMLSVLFGSTIVQYSLVIGIYMFFLGLGSFLYNRFAQKNKNITIFFIYIEIILAITAVLGVFFLFFISPFVGFYSYYFDLLLQVVSLIPVAVVGILSGLELPLLVEIYKTNINFSKVLGIDYFGSLIGTILFALYFYPNFGIYLTVITIATANIFVATFVSIKSGFIKNNKLLFITLFLIFAFLFIKQDVISSHLEKRFMSNIISNIYKTYAVVPQEVRIKDLIHTKYQTIATYDLIFSKYDKDICLNLDRHIQACNNWVDAYHYGAVFVPMSLMNEEKLDILILGGGDFIAVDYFRKFDDKINSIDLVDIDNIFQEFAKTSPIILNWNNNAFTYNKLNIQTLDAFYFLKTNNKKYDLILVDLPGLKHSKLLPLYSVEFYKMLKAALKDNGVVVSWIYPNDMDKFKVFNKVLDNTLIKAGFKNRLIYKALQPDTNTPEETETFMLLSINNKSNIKPTNNYTRKFADIFAKSKWKMIKYHKDVKENSVFKPNISMLIKDYRY